MESSTRRQIEVLTTLALPVLVLLLAFALAAFAFPRVARWLH